MWNVIEQGKFISHTSHFILKTDTGVFYTIYYNERQNKPDFHYNYPVIIALHIPAVIFSDNSENTGRMTTSRITIYTKQIFLTFDISVGNMLLPPGYPLPNIIILLFLVLFLPDYEEFLLKLVLKRKILQIKFNVQLCQNNVGFMFLIHCRPLHS